MKINQTKWLAFIGLMLSIQGHAQVKLPVTSNELRTNLTRVVEAFPSHFSNLRGDTLIENPQTIEFASLLDFKTARENSITQYKSAKPIYSWQAVFTSTEEFDEAVKKYKWLYNQLKVMTITVDNGYSFTMSGDYDAPDESRKFSSSIFKLTPNASSMPKLKIEVSMQFEFPEWKVSLLVYEKEREDDETGDIFGE
ncbi:MAG: hypothetical protein ACJ749_00470 [Flavisolibacter sp.]